MSNKEVSNKESHVGDEVTPFQAQREDIFNTFKMESTISKELHVGSSSHSKLSDDEWVEEKKPIGSNITYSDEDFTMAEEEEKEEEEIMAEKVDNEEKSNSEKNKRTKFHDLGPPPEKVSYVYSGGNTWDAFVDGVAVPPAERLKWAEAFEQIFRGGRDGK